uniref:SR-related CTD associated factor 4 n=1 Tax=Leptobrachium leishanense TaxID=445787 RepID=A0A8C5PMS7_9ANUR
MDMKPPISRAKMILITKAAIKAIKLYKHVVQIVEKFIKKCKPEYKVPGLYVIDSIVRQSRHQFGIDKDVFGPRFIKNLTATFQCLYLCPTEDKSKIVRVLNLWQKNGVFRIEIIQPLLDMAAASVNAAEMLADNSANDEGSSPPQVMMASEPMEVANSEPTVSVPQLPNSDAFAAVAQLFQSTQGQQLQQILQTFQQPPKSQSPTIGENVLAQVQTITSQLNPSHSSHQSHPSHQSHLPHQPERKTAFDKLLDRFDYDDEPEATEDAKKEDSTPPPSTSQPPYSFPGDGIQQSAYTQMPVQMSNMEQFQPLMMGMPQESLHHQQVQLPQNGQMLGFGMMSAQSFPNIAPPVVAQESPQPFQPPYQMPQNEVHMQAELPQETPVEVKQPQPAQESKRHQPEPKDASRSPKRRRSRSNSRSRRSRHRRSRSRSRDRRRHSPKSRSQERRDRERKLKGLPPIKTETVSVCSTTLWVGQLDKRTSQQDVASLLEEFGPIESINMIPPRGCAYIVMVHRLDAFRALNKLSRGNFKVGQKAIKIAWALNKGIKPEFKQYWEVEIGVTYIPWSKVKMDDLQAFCEGGILDNDTLTAEWKSFTKKSESNDVAQNGAAEAKRPEETPPVSQPLPLLTMPMRATLAAMPMPPMSAPQLAALPPHQGIPMVQPQPGTPVPHQGLPPLQALAMPQGVPPMQAMVLPQALHQGIPMPQGLQIPQGMPVPGMGALQHHFPGPISIPPPGFPPPMFMRPGFNPMALPPGFMPPPGMPPPMTPVSIPPPTTAMTIPTSTAGAPPSDVPQELLHGNAIQPNAGRENMETDDDGNGFGSSPQGGANNTPGPVNPHIDAPEASLDQASHSESHQGPPTEPHPGPATSQHQGAPSVLQLDTSSPHQGPSSGSTYEPPGTHHAPPTGPHQGLPSGPHQGPPSGPHQGPPSGPHQGPPSGPHQGPPAGLHQGPPAGPHQGPFSGHHQGPPSGHHQGPPSGHHQGPPSGHHQGPPSGHHQGPPSGPYQGPSGPNQGPPAGPHHGSHHGPPHGSRYGPPSGAHYEPPGPHQGPPSGPHHGPPGPGLGPSTGLLGARPGLIPLQRPPGVPTPHMQRYPSMSHRPFRNERQGFNPERERYGRRPFGNPNEDEREYFDNRFEEPEHERQSNRGRRNWGRGSPDHERYREHEERNRWSMGREGEREPYRGMAEMREMNPNPGMGMHFDEQEPDDIENAENMIKFDKGQEEPNENKPAEEVPAKASEKSETDSASKAESPH